MADSTTHQPVVTVLVEGSSDATSTSHPAESPLQSCSEARPGGATHSEDAAGASAQPATKAHPPAKEGAHATGGAKRHKQPADAGGRSSHAAQHASRIRTGAGGDSTPQRSAFSESELGHFRNELLAERERLLEEVAGLREDSLLRHDEVNHEEDGTDAYIRLSGLDRAGQEQARVIQIDDALRSLEEGHYGLCETCGCCIESARLELLPFVKTCIRCQSEVEGGTRARISARARLWQ